MINYFVDIEGRLMIASDSHIADILGIESDDEYIQVNSIPPISKAIIVNNKVIILTQDGGVIALTKTSTTELSLSGIKNIVAFNNQFLAHSLKDKVYLVNSNLLPVKIMEDIKQIESCGGLNQGNRLIIIPNVGNVKIVRGYIGNVEELECSIDRYQNGLYWCHDRIFGSYGSSIPINDVRIAQQYTTLSGALKYDVIIVITNDRKIKYYDWKYYDIEIEIIPNRFINNYGSRLIEDIDGKLYSYTISAHRDQYKMKVRPTNLSRLIQQKDQIFRSDCVKSVTK